MADPAHATGPQREPDEPGDPSSRLDDQLRQWQKIESIGRLTAGVVHDFNNIITVIQGHASLLLASNNLTDSQTASLREITAAAQRAAGLTQRLLSFSRGQATQLRPVNLNSVVSEMGAMLMRVVNEDIALRLRCEATQPIIHADPGMIEQVLLNLAVNARDAMPGGGELNIETQDVVIKTDHPPDTPELTAGNYVCLSVSDTGSGIPPEHLPRIFEPFFTTKQAGKGTGLGLPTVASIVRQHNGSIVVRSEPGQGTTFRIFLPSLGAVIDHVAALNRSLRIMQETMRRMAEWQGRGNTGESPQDGPKS